jgi:hypothetical protein
MLRLSDLPMRAVSRQIESSQPETMIMGRFAEDD